VPSVPRRSGGSAGRSRASGSQSPTDAGSHYVQPRRHVPLSPAHEPMWGQLYVQRVGATWAAMVVADEEAPPEPGRLKGLAFFGATPEEAEQAA